MLGLVISYRTTSSFERYNEGRRYWSAIILGSRTFARIVWFHVPGASAHELSHLAESYPHFTDIMPENPGDTLSEEERKIRVLIEKKTIINLIEAFAVSTKHHLRAEAGIYYEDLYHLVKFLPPYALPTGLPSMVDLTEMPTNRSSDGIRHSTSRNNRKEGAEPGHLPLPATSGLRSPVLGSVKPHTVDYSFLLPAHNPPQFAIFDVFPFSLLIRRLTERGKNVKGKKAARLRAMRHLADSHNIPLEISLYLVRFQLSQMALYTHPVDRAPTSAPCNPGGQLTRAHPVSICVAELPYPYSSPLAALLNVLLSLTDSLTGLERILTTPIPFSYSFHLWFVTVIYCLTLPFQIWETLGWITIPGTTLVVRNMSPIRTTPRLTTIRL